MNFTNFKNITFALTENKKDINFHLFSNMEWPKKEDRVAVIALHRCGYAPKKIFNILQKLKITLRFVYRTIIRFTEDSSFKDRMRTGRPDSFDWNHGQRVINEDLGLRAYRKKIEHFLNERLKKLWLDRSRALLRRYAGKKYPEILF